MPFGDNGFGDVCGDVGLGAAGHQELRHPRVHPVDRRAGLAKGVDLGGVLDHPQPPQHIGGQHRHHAEHVGQRQQVQRGHRIGDRRGCRRTAQRVGDQPVRIVAVDPVPHRQTEFGHRGFLQGGQLHARHHDRRLAGRRQHQRGQPLEGLRARADEVAQVVARRDDQPGQSGFGGGARGRPEPLRVHVGAESTGASWNSG